MQFGAWNVRTLMDTMHSNRPERMTTSVAQELSRYTTDIAALSETRFAGTGDLAEVGAGYTFFWSGKAADEPREAGVDFAIRTDLIPKLETLPKGINDRMITTRIPLAGNTHLTPISAYAPMMTHFNARAGRNSGAWPWFQVPGKIKRSRDLEEGGGAGPSS